MSNKFTALRNKIIQEENHPEQDGRLQACFNRALEYHQQGEMKKASEAYQQVLQLDPDHVDALCNRGLVLHSMAQFDEAAASYERALSLSPQMGHIHYCLGNAYRDCDRYESAISAYMNALTIQHDHINAMHGLGTLYFHRKMYEEATLCFQCILRRDPHDGIALYNQGLIRFNEKDFQGALRFFEKAMQENSDDVDTCFNLGLTYKALARYDEALACLRDGLELAPGDVELYSNIGVIYKDNGELDQAEQYFKKGLEVHAGHGPSLINLGIIYHVQDRIQESIACYSRALEVGYNVDSARHMLAALSGQTTTTAPAQHLIELFDNYADRFDSSLTSELEYTVPEKLLAVLRSVSPGRRFANGLDLGCGTGLSGSAFRPLTQRLTGVDLSAGMMRKAAEKNVYDSVHLAEIVEFLEKTAERFDLFIATDVFIYLGRLDEFFAAVARCATAGSCLVFSTERCGSQRYCLRQSGRYAHSIDYITELADRHGLIVKQRKETGIRKERGKWIAGDLYVLLFSS